MSKITDVAKANPFASPFADNKIETQLNDKRQIAFAAGAPSGNTFSSKKEKTTSKLSSDDNIYDNEEDDDIKENKVVLKNSNNLVKSENKDVSSPKRKAVTSPTKSSRIMD